MAEIKMTKNELRDQQRRLGQLEKYLPTLKLKKAMLQAEIGVVRQEIREKEERVTYEEGRIDEFVSLLGETLPLDLFFYAKPSEINKRYENIAGVDVPVLEQIDYPPADYSLVDSPAWVDAAIEALRRLTLAQVEVGIAEEKCEALEKELREVSIRVNLFEKQLIPKALKNIKKIRVFLGDQELAAVSRAKVAKVKIEEKKRSLHAH